MFVRVWRGRECRYMEEIEEWLDYAHGFGLKLWVDDDDVAIRMTPFNYFDADLFSICLCA